MSYRALKRLLGETSLERKCRFLFGGFILVLISGSFYLYARQTEHLAYDQITTTCRLLLMQIVDRDLATVCGPSTAQRGSGLVATAAAQIGSGTDSAALLGGLALLHELPRARLRAPDADEDPRWRAQAFDEFRVQQEAHWPEALRQYQYRTLRPDSTRQENKPDDPFSAERLKAFQANTSLREDSRSLLPQRVHQYFGAIRATPTCLACHQQFTPGLSQNGLIALVRIEVPTSSIESGVDLNRAILISIALVTALLIMGGSYIIVRYVIVKPVKHLKEVSDAISAGELNVRSEIQTGDEFEDLSHAFNRMLRTLVSMQDRLRKVNQDLDHKVDELAQANLALYESNRLKSDFLATMTHELRTPLNSILGFSEVLAAAGLTLTEKQARWLQNIRTSGEQLLALINDILDLAKIEAGKMEIRVVEFSSYDVCEGLLTMFRQQAEKKNIDLQANLAPDIPLVRQDVTKFRQILSNLLSNAIKFTPEGGRVVLRGTIVGELLEITVADTGVGIASEEQELVFEKFRQSGNPMTREQGGTGLGLSIVRELTQLLGGTVTLQSELGRGSTFTIRLPLQLSEDVQLEYDLTHEGIDLSKAQRVDARLYGDNASE